MLNVKQRSCEYQLLKSFGLTRPGNRTRVYQLRGGCSNHWLPSWNSFFPYSFKFSLYHPFFQDSKSSQSGLSQMILYIFLSCSISLQAIRNSITKSLSTHNYGLTVSYYGFTTVSERFFSANSSHKRRM